MLRKNVEQDTLSHKRAKPWPASAESARPDKVSWGGSVKSVLPPVFLHGSPIHIQAVSGTRGLLLHAFCCK